MAFLARGSAPFIALPASVTVLLAIPVLLYRPASILLWTVALFFFIAGIGITAIVVNFFRDPDRPVGKGIVSPADGLVRKAEITETVCYVSIFMNVHDVHVNRAPFDGRVTEVKRITGPKLPAYKPEADHNERVCIRMDTARGEFAIIQMVGIVARRILPYIEPGQVLKKGDRIGIIRFGSRVDISFPSKGALLKVHPGQKVRAGTTTLAEVDNENN